MASSAREYFEKLKAEGYDAIVRLPTELELTFENDWREFKGWYAGKEKDLRDAWSKAITAFANTQGGVVLWGVEAAVMPGSKIDRVTGIAEVELPDDWIQKLKGWKLHATDPPIGNIEYCAIPNPTEPKGFVACLIPESDFKPHRAEFADRNYFIRAGDSSVVPSPSLLRSMFYPKPRVDLWLTIKSQVDRGYQTSQVRLNIENRGYSSVRNGVVRLIIHPDDATRITQVCANESELIGSANNRHVQFKLKHAELHPGMSSMFGHVQTNLRSIDLTVVVYQSDCHPLHMRVTPDFVRVKDGELPLVPLDDAGKTALEKLLGEVD